LFLLANSVVDNDELSHVQATVMVSILNLYLYHYILVILSLIYATYKVIRNKVRNK
jgi:hypothetical protein